MVLLEKLWDDIVAGPHPERGLESLRKISPTPLIIKDVGEGSMTSSLPASPTTPGTPLSARKENVWRSVFHPGSNLATKTMGAQLFDKPQHSNSPSVYDWLYSGETKSTHRGG